jgi:hypothetical protein
MTGHVQHDDADANDDEIMIPVMNDDVMSMMTPTRG